MITIITLGKLKESYWREAEGEYLKRLTPYAKINIVELREEPFDEKSPPEKIKAREAEKIIAILEKNKNAHIIALDETGKEFSSKKFSSELEKTTGNIIFILGGPLGLHSSIKDAAHAVISLSQMTFTHQMARVILLEQIYRAMMIKTGRRYHY
jgi:23S rRNA (pseudouridine1915-N3)-methyltransferase